MRATDVAHPPTYPPKMSAEQVSETPQTAKRTMRVRRANACCPAWIAVPVKAAMLGVHICFASKFHWVIVIVLLSARTLQAWVVQFKQDHLYGINRCCHLFGIPLVIASTLVGIAALGVPLLWWSVVALFALGSAIQLLGHWYEGTWPSFTNDPRFLIVGLG